jgi:hypothetical protein
MFNGVKSKTYTYALIFGMALLSPLLFIFFDFQLLDISISAFLFILLFSVVRVFNLLANSEVLKRMGPFELNLYTTSSIVFIFLIDSLIIGSMVFDLNKLFLLIALFILVCFMIKESKTALTSKAIIAINVGTKVLMGYLAYFAMQSINSATFLFVMAVMGLILVLPFYNKFELNKDTLSMSLKVQFLGLLSILMSTTLAQISATYYMLTVPARLSIVILASWIFRNKFTFVRPVTKRQFLLSLLILLIVLFYSI